ncbi:hypothetical protein ESCNG_70026 [Neisseria gonorrhoeae]|nr:hypothetical protein ESCNG_70026 [Neisseria gonorrhoeae]
MFSTRSMPPAAATANRKKPRVHTTRTATGWSSEKRRGDFRIGRIGTRQTARCENLRRTRRLRRQQRRHQYRRRRSRIHHDARCGFFRRYAASGLRRKQRCLPYFHAPPRRKGAILAFQTALQHAGLAPEDIGRINLHGTGTHHNGSMESRAVAAVFGNNTPCTSAKPQTGHTLGAAGAIEAAFAWGIADRQSNPEGKLPPRLWDGQNDPDLPAINLTGGGWETEKRIAASSSFAFGGSNCVLIIG